MVLRIVAAESFMVPFSRSNPTPKLVSNSAMKAMSASFGTLESTSGDSVRSAAAMSGKAAFLAPLMGIAPASRTPPSMRMRSMNCLFLARVRAEGKRGS